jgi:hypothetical protein
MVLLIDTASTTTHILCVMIRKMLFITLFIFYATPLHYATVCLKRFAYRLIAFATFIYKIDIQLLYCITQMVQYTTPLMRFATPLMRSATPLMRSAVFFICFANVHFLPSMKNTLCSSFNIHFSKPYCAKRSITVYQ